MDKKLLAAMLDSLRRGTDPIGVFLRETDVLPFTGATTVDYTLDDDEGAEVITQRMIDYLRKRDKQGLLRMPDGWYLIPAGWEEVLIRYLKENWSKEGNKYTKLIDAKPEEKWEKYVIIPNKRTGNRWLYVVFSGTYVIRYNAPKD